MKSLAMQKQLKIKLMEADQKTLKIRFRPATKPVQFSEDGFETDRHLLGQPIREDVKIQTQQPAEILSDSPPGEINSLDGLLSVLGSNQIVLIQGKRYIINLASRSNPRINPLTTVDSATSRVIEQQSSVPLVVVTSTIRTEIVQEPKPLQMIQLSSIQQEPEDLDDFYASLALSIGQDLEPKKQGENLDEFYAALTQSLQSELVCLPEPVEDLDQFYASLSLDIASELLQEKQEIPEDDFYAQLSLNLAIDLPQKSEEKKPENLAVEKNSEDEYYSQLALKLSEDLEPRADMSDEGKSQLAQKNDQVNPSPLPEQSLDIIRSSFKTKIHEKKKVVIFAEEQPSPNRNTFFQPDLKPGFNKLGVAIAKKAHTLRAANNMIDFQFDSILDQAATLKEVKKERLKKQIQDDQSWFKKVQENLMREESSLPQTKQIEPQAQDDEEICLSSSSDSVNEIDSPLKHSSTQLFDHMKTKFLTEIAQNFASQMGIESTKFDFSKQRQDSQRKSFHVGQLLKEDLASDDQNLESVVKSLQVQMACLKSMVKLSWEDGEHHSNAIKKITLNEINNRKLTEVIVEKLNSKVKTFQTLFDKMQYKTKLLHFAFLFACPLVMSFQGPETTKTQYKLVPALNYQQEFQRIQNHLSRAKIKCGVMKRSCTIDNLKEILGHQPIGMHFSGHGILNNFESVGDYHYLHKDEGDFLLMETAEGDSQLVSRQQLQKLIQATQTNLEFVFIATCHSEFVGQIFKQAGAKNVICIDEKHEVQDSAIILFTDMFYGSIFTNVPVPVAFQQAKLLVSIKFDEKEASIFKLLRRNENHENQVHVFGPFDEGMWVCHDLAVTIQNQTPKVALLVGRQKDMFKIIQKVMSEKSSRLITLLGLPGVGKTALIRNTVHYIQERRLFQGGCIFSNAQNIKDAKEYVSALISQVIKETRDIPDCDGLESLIEEGKTVLDQLNSLFFYIAKLKGQLLYVIDNAEDLITNDKANFRIVIQHILLACSNIKIVITSRFRLVSLPEETEEVLMIGPISMAASVQLFRHFTREIPQSEINELLAIVPDPEKYPQEALKPKPKKLQDHHFFALLGGNPQSIILTSPLLADSEKQLTLSILYKMQTSNQITQMLQRENIEDKMLASLRISIYISIQMLQETDPVCMSLFYLLGMLPGGVTDDELGNLWDCLQEPIPWRTVIQLLQKNQLVVQGKVNGITKNYLPEFISSYAEAMASEEQKQIYHDVICTVLLRKMENWYFRINNTNNKDFESDTTLVVSEMMQVKENIEALVQRMSEKNAHSLHAVAIQGDATVPRRSIILDPQNIASFQHELLKSTTLKAKQKKFDLTKILGEALKKHLAKTKEEMSKDNEWSELSSSYNELKQNQLRQKSLQSVMKYNNFSMKFSNTRTSASNQGIQNATPIERFRIAVKKVIKENKEKKNRKKMGFVKISGQKDDDDVEMGTSEDEAPKKDNFFLVVQGMCLDKQTKMEKKIELMAAQLNSFRIKNQPEKQKKTLQTQQTLKRHSAVVLDLKKQSSTTNEDRLSTEEQLIIEYLMNLTLLGKPKEATEMISKYFVTFIDWHQVFMGNVYRIKAFNQFIICQQESKTDKTKSDDTKVKFEQVINLYKIAVELFTACECTWGMGITLFQIALVYKELHRHTETNKTLEQACQEFQKINHYRGLAMCCKQMGMLLRGSKSQQANNYQKSYQEYLMHFHSGKSKYYNYLSVMRSQGEDYCLQTEIVLITRCQTIFEKENELKIKIAKNLLSKVVQIKFQDLEPIDDKSESSQEYSSSSDQSVDNQSRQKSALSGSSRSRNSRSNGPLYLQQQRQSDEVVKKIQNQINLYQKLETKIRPIILNYTDSKINQADCALAKDKITENSLNQITQSDWEEQKVNLAIKIETNETQENQYDTLDHQEILIFVSDLKDKTLPASSSFSRYLPQYQQFEEQQSRSFSQSRRPIGLLSPKYRPDSHMYRSFQTNQLMSPNFRQYSRSPFTPTKHSRTPIGFISSKDFF